MSQPQPSSDDYRSRAPASSPFSPRVALSVRWSRAAGRALELYPDAPARRQLNVAARRATLLTLKNAAPRFVALQRQLQRQLQRELQLHPTHDTKPDSLSLSIDLMFVDDARIHKLNREGRGYDRPTDVLSYPLWELPAGEWGGWPFQGDEHENDSGEEEGTVALGDLVISVPTAARQASELGHDLASEVAFLCIHGTLHLLGYDHDTASRRRTMWRQQDALFEQWNRVSARKSPARDLVSPRQRAASSAPC